MIDPNTAADLTVGAIVVPPVVAILNQRHWHPMVKGVVALLGCLGAAALMAAWHGELDLANWRDSVIKVTAAALVMYRVWWQPSTIAPALESATTPGSGPRHAVPE